MGTSRLLPPLPLTTRRTPALAVDVAGLELGRFAQAQTAVVHHGEQGAQPALPDRAEQLLHLLAADDVGKQLLAVELDLLPALPVPSEVVAVETAQGTERLVDGGVLAARAPPSGGAGSPGPWSRPGAGSTCRRSAWTRRRTHER